MEYSARTPEQLGKILAAFRKASGISQKDAGARVGMLQKSVSMIETKPENVSIRLLFKMLSALGLEVAIRPKGSET